MMAQDAEEMGESGIVIDGGIGLSTKIALFQVKFRVLV